MKLIINGKGGQGVLFLSKVLAESLLHEGIDNFTFLKEFDEGQRNGEIKITFELPFIMDDKFITICENNIVELKKISHFLGINNNSIKYALNKIKPDYFEKNWELFNSSNKNCNSLNESDCINSPKIDLIVWDLDNTLWNGTVYYKDKNTVNIKPGTKATLKELNKRNIICTVCSKNYYKDGIDKLEEFEIKKYFSDFKIGWERKSESIKEILNKFNVKPENTLFIDDDAFQREEVESSIPNINTLFVSDPIDILNVDGIIPINATSTDKDRVILLKQQRNREEAERTRKEDYKDFLKECNIKMNVSLGKETDIQRITQLLNRTNELNATNNRYSFEEIKELFNDEKHKFIIVNLSDKFGNYGLIAESLIEINNIDKSIFIKDLTVSCRTMGRGIGGALLISILRYAKNNNFDKVIGYVEETESNWRMKPLFEKRNFKLLKEENNRKYYSFNVNNDISNYPNFLKVTEEF
jgi:FkbH-like protein